MPPVEIYGDTMLEKDGGSYWLECDQCDESYGTLAAPDDCEYFDLDELEADASNDGWFVDCRYDNGPEQYRADFCCEECKDEWEAGYYGS
jgi:hypothetical protein